MPAMISTLNAQKRKLGIAGLDHDEYPHDEYVRQVTSAGRTDPVFQQGIIPQKGVMTLPPNEFADTMLPEDLMAPRAARQMQMKPMIGEWCVKRVPKMGTTRAALSGGLFAELEVFTCANEIPKDYDFSFQGIITNPQDLAEANRDDVGGFDIQGTVSGINTGPDHLRAGDIVWMGRPYMIENESGPNGEKKRVMGVVWDGGEPDKAYFGTYRLRWSCVVDALTEVRQVLRDMQNRDESSVDFANHASLATSLSRDHGVREEMPIFSYAMIEAHRLSLYRWNKKAARAKKPDRPALVKSLAEVVNEFHKYLQTLEDATNAIRDAFDDSLGVAKMDYVGDSHPLTSKQHLDLNADFHTVGQRMLLLLNFGSEYREVAHSRMHDFLNARVMGKVLTSSAPGEQLDVNLGCGLGR